MLTLPFQKPSTKKKNKQKTKHPSRETDSVSGKNQPLSISCPIKTHPADSSNHAHSVPFKPRKPLQSLSAKGLVMKTLARCSQRWVGEAHARPHPRVLQAWLPTPPRRLRKISEHIQTRAWPGPGREKMREGKCKTEGPQAEEALLWRGARKRVSKRACGEPLSVYTGSLAYPSVAVFARAGSENPLFIAIFPSRGG